MTHGAPHPATNGASAISARDRIVAAAGRAARIHALLRGLECASVGALGAAVVFAAGVGSGARVGTPLVVVSSAVCALAVATAWRARPPRLGDVDRRADRSARLEGALTTLLGRARSSRAASSELDEVLARRVADALRRGDLARAAFPRTPLAVAALLLAVALVVQAADRRPVATRGAETASLRAAAESLRADGDAAAADVLELAARRIESADRTAASAREPEDAPSDAAADIERAVRALPAGSPERAELERMSAALAASRARSAAPESRAGSVPTADRTPAGTTVDPDPAAAPGIQGAATGGATLANGHGDGRMLGPPAGGESDPQSGVPASGASATGGTAGGVLSARWWPSRYDAVVERYLTP